MAPLAIRFPSFSPKGSTKRVRHFFRLAAGAAGTAEADVPGLDRGLDLPRNAERHLGSTWNLFNLFSARNLFQLNESLPKISVSAEYVNEVMCRNSISSVA